MFIKTFRLRLGVNYYYLSSFYYKILVEKIPVINAKISKIQNEGGIFFIFHTIFCKQNLDYLFKVKLTPPELFFAAVFLQGRNFA